MGTILPVPDSTDTTAFATYQARMQIVRNRLSPDITVRFTITEIPDAILSEAGALLRHEAKVMKDSGKSATDIQALADDSDDLTALVDATLTLITLDHLPQAAQMTREGLIGETKQYQEIDWELREVKLENDYKAAILLVNAAATFETGSGGSEFGSATVLRTKSRL